MTPFHGAGVSTRDEIRRRVATIGAVCLWLGERPKAPTLGFANAAKSP